MATTNRQTNRPSPLERAIEAVTKKYPTIDRGGVRLILDEIPSEIFHELGDAKRMVGEQS